MFGLVQLVHLRRPVLAVTMLTLVLVLVPPVVALKVHWDALRLNEPVPLVFVRVLLVLFPVLTRADLMLVV
jgi:hypothetical protein